MPRALLVLSLLAAIQTSAQWRPVPPAGLARLKPSQFNDGELDLPYYLAHFHRLANAVVEHGEDRGFIRLNVWRAPKDNHPYNARIMENILSLAWFYTANRPWNPYYASPDVRGRLEAALDFWCRIQAPTGAFSEYSPKGWNLAATAFATKFMGRTLILLRDGPPIDKSLLDRVRQAQRKAIHFVLTDTRFWEHGRNFSNQFTNVWPGGFAWLHLHDDPEIRTLIEKRIAESKTAFQSPAGYFYEAGGPDWSYNFGTHHSNLLGAWSYTKETPLGKHFIEEERRFFEWVSYNAVPDGNEWVLNRAIETRQSAPVVRFSYRYPLAEHVPVARPFLPARESEAERLKALRAQLERNWPSVPELPVGEFTAFAPYVFLHRHEQQWLPSQAERAAARELLPYFARNRFVHRREDTRFPAVFTYIRRPAYYAAFNSGKRIRDQQRLGLGLLWTETAGSILQSQSRTGDTAWGTRAQGASVPYEAADLPAQFDSDLVITYALGGQGEKTLAFGDREIQIRIKHPGPFIEQLPLLCAAPPAEFSPGFWRIGPGVIVAAGGARLRPHSVQTAGKTLYSLEIPGETDLKYSFRFE